MTTNAEIVQQLPDLTVSSSHGELNLADLTSHYNLLYFYPRDLTAGCTTQAQDFRDLQPEFEQFGVKIYGASRDTLARHAKFIEKENIPFPLISDPEEVLCRQFDVIKTKNMYGKQVQGIERSSFLFNPQGQLVKSWRKVRAAGHAKAVLQFVKDQSL
ncbi:peroxiredoxin [Alkanindiges sp. WGS2144]|uniref:peroxiredoxin n=1 Tax=Alkanindiges sp. WGS2144 TaxID=3366808 RepID=UPI003750C1DF